MHQGSGKASPRPSPRANDVAASSMGVALLRQSCIVMLAGYCLVVGTGCPNVIEQYTVSTIPQLSESPSLAEMAMVVNQNAAHVQSLYTSDVKIKGSRLPSVSAKLAYVAPRRFRLVAETALTGVEVDLGSNDELFWFWARRNDPPTMFFCRHDQYQNSEASQMMPIDPQWVIDSMGLATLDLNDRHNGPHPLGDGRFAVDTLIPRPSGIWTRTIIVDSKFGTVVEQHLRDPHGRLVTSAVTSEHDRDPLNEVTVPGRIELSWPAAEFTLTITVNEWEINYPDERPAALWQMPQSNTDQLIDLANPGALMQSASAANR